MARPRLHDDALRTRLLEVASRAISSGGEAAVTVRTVATEAGTSPSAVYALFGSREDLVAAVSEEGFRRFATHLGAAPRTDDPGADLVALGLAYRESALADPHFYRVMFDRAVPPEARTGVAADAREAGGPPSGTAADGETLPVPATQRPTFGVLRDAVARVLGGAPPERVESAAVGLWGLVHGLVTLELAGLLPGDAATRERRYAEAAGTVGPGLLRADPVRP
ncbi:TetR/AcrR family transcriptional regulator [Antribacter sp. KLBMP9083]|uniref:TetR/AcrR family transcriptional regulator n=1 Tax=Antribacter soli TaxID=2910976 RepID=A0AA41U8Z4_9MICO|nr:TetR/AcrR family transcriptional regulator [Antribacter soli]MCF4122970.1 TetR/AcrR family transcriptional regulator [Antribacter soli]